MNSKNPRTSFVGQLLASEQLSLKRSRGNRAQLSITLDFMGVQPDLRPAHRLLRRQPYNCALIWGPT